jgi:hypothetical protein
MSSRVSLVTHDWNRGRRSPIEEFLKTFHSEHKKQSKPACINQQLKGARWKRVFGTSILAPAWPSPGPDGKEFRSVASQLRVAEADSGWAMQMLCVRCERDENAGTRDSFGCWRGVARSLVIEQNTAHSLSLTVTNPRRTLEQESIVFERRE